MVDGVLDLKSRQFLHLKSERLTGPLLKRIVVGLDPEVPVSG